MKITKKKLRSIIREETAKEEISAAEVKAQLAQVLDLLSSARAMITSDLGQDLALEDLYEAEEIVGDLQRTLQRGEKFFFSR